MDDGVAKKAKKNAARGSKTVDDSSAERTRKRGIRGIARAQIARHGLLSRLSLKERALALAQWLRGIQP
jgi:hypothetical protein